MLDLLLLESPTPKQVENSLIGFAQRVQRFGSRLGLSDIGCDHKILVESHVFAMHLLHQYFSPSWFKSAAALTISISATRPFDIALPTAYGVLANYPNAVISILESAYWLHEAQFQSSTGSVCQLENPIEFSEHLFKEFVTANGHLGSMVTASTEISQDNNVKLKLLALTYESLAYETNPSCKYPPPTALQIDLYR